METKTRIRTLLQSIKTETAHIDRLNRKGVVTEESVSGMWVHLKKIYNAWSELHSLNSHWHDVIMEDDQS